MEQCHHGGFSHLNLEASLQTCLEAYPFKDLNPVKLTIKITHHILVNPHLCFPVGGWDRELSIVSVAGCID